VAKIAFLTRGDEHWGMGHLHRVSWLVQEVIAQTGRSVECEVRCLDSEPARSFWEQCALGTPVSFHVTAEDAAQGHADIFVIDWLASPAEYVRDIAGRGSHVVLLDDNGPAQTAADLVINALITPLVTTEPNGEENKVLGGAKFVQLPPAVTKLRGVAQATTRAMATELSEPVQPGPVRAALVSFGGSPREELISLALTCLADVGFGGRILVMPAPDTALDTLGLDVELIPAGAGFHELLAAADLPILGGGLSLFEAAFLGVPGIAIAIDSDVPGYERHQLDTAGRLADAGCCLSVGLASEVSEEAVTIAISRLLADAALRGRMSAAGMRLLDGQGLQRTTTAILDLF
jgi:spore coat polysaccharide biosynthesis predicted glycosyltransferase SpsG